MAPPTSKSFLAVPSLIIFQILITTFFSPSLSSPTKISYAEHCRSIVPPSSASGLTLETTTYIHLSNGLFSGGDKILAPDTDSDTSSISANPGSVYFYSNALYRTKTPGLIRVDGSLNFECAAGASIAFPNNYSRRSRRHRRFPYYTKSVNFQLSGYWSQSTGRLCMVGSGSATSKQGTDQLKLSAVFKLDYPMNTTISTSTVTGTVESLDSSESKNHFDSISIFGYAQNNYVYTQITDQVRETCSKVNLPENLLGFDKDPSYFSYLQDFLSGWFQFQNGSDFGPIFSNKSLGFNPNFMAFNQIQHSEDKKLHMYIGFGDGANYILIPEKSLVAEGFWDSEKKHLCLVACPVLKTNDSSSVGECTIGLSLWFPAFLTIKDRAVALGRMWSNKDKADPGYFGSITFRRIENKIGVLPGLKYEYTEIDSVRKSCKNDQVTNLTNYQYPEGNSRVMRFDIMVQDKKGITMWGSATLMSFGETFYGNSFVQSIPEVGSDIILGVTNGSVGSSRWNVSYTITYRSFNSSFNVTKLTDIAAEGIYNSGSGTLCMVGCRILSSSDVSETGKTNDSMDCEILINFQLPPLNLVNGDNLNGSMSSSTHLNGTIRSTRKMSDPLYFDPLEVSSNNIYNTAAIETVSRMDIEIAMVLFSLTLSCIFIGFQLFHVKKRPDVLPLISITMLVILTLGHMIPLVLNFEALFFNNRNRQNVLLWSGGWLEVNEVIVRVMTMLAFLLQFRLLHSAWTVRSSDEGRKGLWISERKALRFCLPLYFAGALIAWFVHTRSYETQLTRMDFFSEHYHSVWEDLISYGGLILDGFLLPQIILNLIWNSKDKALAPLFYIGTTAVRAVPHLYDAYRARYYVPYFRSSYIYANPDGDLFSSAWDIIIPIGGLLFTVLLFLQQRFGGSFFLPQRFRKPSGYETVSTISL